VFAGACHDDCIIIAKEQKRAAGSIQFGVETDAQAVGGMRGGIFACKMGEGLIETTPPADKVEGKLQKERR
jgi:hypothetical protein